MHDRFNGMGEVFFALCKGIDTPVSLAQWLRFKYRDHIGIAEKAVRPGDYLSADAFRMDYLVTEFLSKWKGLQTGVDLEAKALSKFTQAEVVCQESNRRIRALRVAVDPATDGIFLAAQRKIARVLGRFSLFCFDGDERWGPHATLDISRRRAAIDTKMCELPITVTRTALPFLKRAIERDLHWSAAILGVIPEGPFSLMPGTFEVVEHCRVETVPKNAKTHRVIAVEPRGNGFLQKGVGAYIRRQLRKVGIDLNDQTRNQEAAKAAFEKRLATVDLSMASDTVCREIVYDLLPFEWASYLDDLRSKWAVLPDGSRVRLEKFSSMGNGFTFELESLIFWAIARAVVDQRDSTGTVLVYGDDIVVPQEDVSALKLCLSRAGFLMNSEKTHLGETPFFESCGKHYFGGSDVTPCYQKEVLDDDREVVRLGNRLIRFALRSGFGDVLDARIESAWLASRRLAPSMSAFCIPLGSEGDDGWVLPRSSWPLGVQYDRNFGYRCQVTSSPSKTFPGYEAALLAYSLRQRGQASACYGNVSFPDADRVIPVHRWVTPSREFGVDWT